MLLKMRAVLLVFTCFSIVVVIACRPNEKGTRIEVSDTLQNIDSLGNDWSPLEEVSSEDGVILDLKYAGQENFVGEKIYPCPRCYLHPVLAKKVKLLQKDVSKRYGWSLKLFDCYRPRPAQKRLWTIKPDPNYVTDPQLGSMHNRGLAVDLTLVDKNGREMDMGTPFDFFGTASHSDYTDLPQTVIKNRSILRKLMELHGLKGIRTEWWHYSLQSISAPLSDWEWQCE
jgi:D-alanyl-D-alanine dipeptidase